MNEKQHIFIESLVGMSKVVPEYTEPLKTIAKSYIITEGFGDKIKQFGSKVKNALTTDPSKVEMPQQTGLSEGDKKLIEQDQATFKQDYMQFLDDVKTLKFHIHAYGDAAFMTYISDKEKYNFDDAIRKGRYLDMIKKRAGIPDVVQEAIDRVLMFDAVLESIASMGYMSLAKHVHDAYEVVELNHGIPTKYLVESAFDDMDALMEMVKTSEQMAKEQTENNRIIGTIMPRIANFIAKHGYSIWEKVLKSLTFRAATQAGSDIRKGVRHAGVIGNG